MPVLSRGPASALSHFPCPAGQDQGRFPARSSWRGLGTTHPDPDCSRSPQGPAKIRPYTPLLRASHMDRNPFSPQFKRFQSTWPGEERIEGSGIGDDSPGSAVAGRATLGWPQSPPEIPCPCPVMLRESAEGKQLVFSFRKHLRVSRVHPTPQRQGACRVSQNDDQGVQGTQRVAS
ncbi:hypothetical protein P7K49_002374, partial [Saguinus oedipus]